MPQKDKFLAIAAQGVALSENVAGMAGMAVYAKQTLALYQEDWPEAAFAIGDTVQAAEEAALAKLS